MSLAPDGQTARLWRRTLAVLTGLEALGLVGSVLYGRTIYGPDPTYAAPIRFLADHAWASVALGAALVVSAVGLFRGRAPVRWTLAAIACAGVLAEVNTAIYRDRLFIFFGLGAALFGYAFGTALAGVSGVRSSDPDEPPAIAAERLGALCACAAFGVCYFLAGLTKLLVGGLAWMNPAVIRLVGLIERPVEEGVWPPPAVWDLLESNGEVAWVFAMLTVAVELTGLVYAYGKWARLLVGTALLGFHVVLAVLTGVIWPEWVTMLLVFSYPWGRGLRAPAPPPLVVGATGWSRPLVFGAIALGIVGAVGAVGDVDPGRGVYFAGGAEAHDGLRGVDRLGPLAAGGSSGVDGWGVADLRASLFEPQALVTLERGADGARILVRLEALPALGALGSNAVAPFTARGRLGLSYDALVPGSGGAEPDPEPTLDAFADVLQSRASSAADPGDAFEGWLEQAR